VIQVISQSDKQLGLTFSQFDILLQLVLGKHGWLSHHVEKSRVHLVRINKGKGEGRGSLDTVQIDDKNSKDHPTNVMHHARSAHATPTRHDEP
jgi:hypothetical protein